MIYKLSILTFILFSFTSAFAQNETINNKTVIDMSRAGLSSEIILKKIGQSRAVFDVSAPRLIELKSAGVDDSVIAAMMDRTEIAPPSETEPATASASSNSMAFSESGPAPPVSGEQALASAKTIAFGKSSLQPSRQALEKELLKRKDFQQLNLTILRYKEQADLFVDIGYVSGSWITHRYVYRIYDRRSGAILTAGETTSWGSLAENLARHITKSLVTARAGKMD
jgi:hypothetical protein